MFDSENRATAPHVWDVGALCRAIADALQARFNPVAVRGEVAGFSRAASGHCYFTLKDVQGQMRCAMFRRTADGLGFMPRDGELVEVQGRLGVYEQRGDLQLVVEGMQRAGQGALFEQFLRLKDRLQAEGLFESARKRALPAMPRAIGLVTSLGAAALHDVATALARRVPHIPVIVVPALVQGMPAPASLCQALLKMYLLTPSGEGERSIKHQIPPVDVILLVRGGGSMEDLWAFNDEQLARTIVQSPVPIVSGVGHETDFTITDFCADLRAPTPTAAAELVAQSQAHWLQALDLLRQRLSDGGQRQIEQRYQRQDMAAQRLGRPSSILAGAHARLGHLAQRMQHAVRMHLQQAQQTQHHLGSRLPMALPHVLARHAERLDKAALRMQLLNPQHVLERGYAVLTDARGHVVLRASQVGLGDPLQARLAEGVLDLTVSQPRLL